MNVSVFQQLVICAIHYPPLSLLNCSMTGDELFSKSGIVFDLFSYFTSNLNFSHEFRCVSMTASQRLRNGSWTGTIGKIDTEECHMILLPYGILYERYKYLTYSADIYTLPVLMVSGEPSLKVRSAAEQFFRSNPMCLVSVLLGILIISVIIGIIEKISDPTLSSSFGDYLYGIVSDFLILFNDPNDIPLLLKSFRSKLILVLWRFAILVIKIHLGASVNAHLTTLKPYLIDDYRDVLSWPKLQPLMYDNTKFQSYFRNSENVEERALWRQVVRTKGLIKRAKLKNYRYDISRGKSVLIADPLDFSEALPQLCRDTKPQPRLHISRRPSTWFSSAFLVSRSFPKQILENINVLIRNYVEFAHIEYVIGRGFSEYYFCLWKPAVSNTFEKKNVNFLVYLWSSAILISTLTLVIELLVFRFEGRLRTASLTITAIVSALGIFFWSQIAPT